jgi:hypothetical protein
MGERSKAVASDGWLERALARWEWEGGHIAPHAERRATPDVENRIQMREKEEHVVVTTYHRLVRQAIVMLLRPRA